jgi:hypothetical protein
MHHARCTLGLSSLASTGPCTRGGMLRILYWIVIARRLNALRAMPIAARATSHRPSSKILEFDSREFGI